MIGFGGVLQVARQGGGNPQTGNFFLMPALSASFLGATAIHPGRFNVPGTIVAVFFLATTVSGLSLSGVNTWVESVFNGTALAVAVGLSTWLGRRRAGGGGRRGVRATHNLKNRGGAGWGRTRGETRGVGGKSATDEAIR